MRKIVFLFVFVAAAIFVGCSQEAERPKLAVKQVMKLPESPLSLLAGEYPFDEGMPPAPAWGRCPLKCYKFLSDRGDLGISQPTPCPKVQQNKDWCVPDGKAHMFRIVGADIRVHKGVYYLMFWPHMKPRLKPEFVLATTPPQP